MRDSGENRPRRFLIALVVGCLLGAVVGLAIKGTLYGKAGSDASIRRANAAAGEGTEAAMEQDGVAWQYAHAYQDGNWTRVVELTYWIKDRLAFVARTGTPEDVAQERDRLVAQVSTRRITDNQLRDGGAEDQYFFTPGAQLNYILDDSGRDDLAAEVARRTWFNVVFPNREKALLDREGIPIHSIYVGVNVSLDGYVLKAGVIGNLDIDWDSIKYDWPSR